MDRMYYQLMEECNDITRLSMAIIQNADYKPELKAAADPFIIDCIKKTQELNRAFHEVLNRMEYANVMSMRQ